MRLDHDRLRGRIIQGRLREWPRILASRYIASPTDTGFGSSRFSSPSNAFRVLYAAEDFPTAFAEAVVRDRLEGKARRYLYRPRLKALCVAAISSNREMRILDTTGGATYELGVDTDTNRARDHQSGQAFSEALHAALPDLDGILFNSRLTARRCVAVYDRAFGALEAEPPVALLRVQQLRGEIERLGISLRRERGLAPAAK